MKKKKKIWKIYNMDTLNKKLIDSFYPAYNPLNVTKSLTSLITKDNMDLSK